MSGPKTNVAALSAKGRQLAIFAARFNDAIVSKLLDGARQAWIAHEGEEADLMVMRVPGAFELPLAAQACANSGRFDAVVALGCVIRGDTPHFEYVAGECARGLQTVALQTGVPVAFGVLTVENEQQARERCAPGAGNKGAEALESVLEMIDALKLA